MEEHEPLKKLLCRLRSNIHKDCKLGYRKNGVGVKKQLATRERTPLRHLEAQAREAMQSQGHDSVPELLQLCPM